MQGASQAGQTESSPPPCYNTHCYCSIMFSDSLGKGLGTLISNNLSHSSQNYCAPQASYNQITSSITQKELNPNAIITILVGNSSNVKIDDITDNVTQLLKLNCKKIILCAFPYLEKLSSRQNQFIHNLNDRMHLLVSHYSDKLTFFDTNSFVQKLKSTRNNAYLPISFRRQIARLLAFNINTDISGMSQFFVNSFTKISNYPNCNYTNINLDLN